MFFATYLGPGHSDIRLSKVTHTSFPQVNPPVFHGESIDILRPGGIYNLFSVSESAPWSPPSWMCLGYLHTEASRRNPSSF